MENLITSLNKRRSVIFSIIGIFSVLSLLIHFNYEITVFSYFEEKYNILFIYGLIVYKLFELPLLYYILLHRHLIILKKEGGYAEVYPKLEKQSKVFFFLIIQGNTIFGLIAYKLSANILFFLLFMLIALIITHIIKPTKIFT